MSATHAECLCDFLGRQGHPRQAFGRLQLSGMVRVEGHGASLDAEVSIGASDATPCATTAAKGEVDRGCITAAGTEDEATDGGFAVRLLP